MKTFDDFEQANCRISQIVHIPSLGSRTDAFNSFVEDVYDYDKNIDRLRTQHPKLAEILAKVEDPDTEELLELLWDKAVFTGLIAKVEVPVPTYPEHGDGTSYSFSWGHYTSTWIYGDDMDQIEDRAIAFAETFYEGEKQSHLAKQAVA